jgi:hypothetical protein
MGENPYVYYGQHELNAQQKQIKTAFKLRGFSA